MWTKSDPNRASRRDVTDQDIHDLSATGRSAAELIAECDALAEQVRELMDCRICDHFTRAAGGCMSTVKCVNAQQLTVSKSRVKRYWEVKP